MNISLAFTYQDNAFPLILANQEFLSLTKTINFLFLP